MKSVFEHQAKHPWLTTVLFMFLFPPALLLVIGIGKVLQRLFPEPQFWMILPGAALFITAFVAGMLIGATLFVFVMKHFVNKAVLAPFYLYPGVPVTSNLSALIFRWAYGRDEASDKARSPLVSAVPVRLYFSPCAIPMRLRSSAD